MRTRSIAFALLAIVLFLDGAAGVLAQESAWPPAPLTPLDAAPWRAAPGAWAAAAPEEEPELWEIRVAGDTFVASQYPFDNWSFGSETSLWFGSRTDLGHLRTLLSWDVQPPPGAEYRAAAIYLPIAGANADLPLDVTVYRNNTSWSETWGGVNWYTQPSVWPEPFAHVTIGAERGWYWFDATALGREWWQSPYTNQGIQLRGPETSANIAKGMFAHEAGDDMPVPTLVIAYLPDRTPPSCVMNSLPEVSPSPIRVQARCSDVRAGLLAAELQVRQGDGAWQAVAGFNATHALLGSFDFDAATGGQRYAFRLRASDRAGNMSDWTAEAAAVTTVEAVPPVLTVSGALPAWLRADAGHSLEFLAQDAGPVSSPPAVVEFAVHHPATGVTQFAKNWGGLALLPGQRYTFKARSVDRARNTGPWIPLGAATIYARSASGKVTDARGQPMQGVALRSDPAAINQPTTDSNGDFALYRVDHGAFGLESAAPAHVYVQQVAVTPANHDITGLVLRAGLRQQSIVNGDFSAPLASGWSNRLGQVFVQPLFSLNDTNRYARFGAPPVMTLVGQTVVAPWYQGCMAAGPDGALHIVIMHSPQMLGGDRTVYYLTRPAGSLAWDAPQSLGSFEQGAVIYPGSTSCFLAAAPDGGVGLLYRMPTQDFWVAPVFRYRPPGGEWGPIEWLPPDREMALAMGPGGAAHVLVADISRGQWMDYQLRYYYREPGGGWRAPVPIASFSAGSGYAAILAGPGDTRHVLWTADYSPDGALKYASSSDGQAWSPAVALVRPAESQFVANPVLRLSPAQGVHAFWLQSLPNTAHWIVSHAGLVGDQWEAPRPLPLPQGITQVAAFAADVDPAGRWHILLSPQYRHPYDEVTDFLRSGVDLANLATTARLAMSNDGRAQRLLVADSVDTHLIRHVSRDPQSPGVFNATPLLTSIPHEPSQTASSISQAVTIPVDTLEPTLVWRAGVGHTDQDSGGGELRVSLTGPGGAGHQLSVISGAAESGAEWFDAAPWAGKQITLSFHFDPRGDRSAWGWVDDIYLGPVPLNAGVSLARVAAPRSGQPFTFTLTVSNRRAGALNVPVRLTWPAGWSLTADPAPGAAQSGAARFDILLDGMASKTITCVAEIPPGAEPIKRTISAVIQQPVAAQDYTPSDNQAALRVIVDGQHRWLPLVSR